MRCRVRFASGSRNGRWMRVVVKPSGVPIDALGTVDTRAASEFRSAGEAKRVVEALKRARKIQADEAYRFVHVVKPAF